MDRWLQSFRAGLEAADLLRGVRRLLVAVSGGPDSVCLLQLFFELVRDVRVPLELLVGHVHHGIRGAEADRDAESVERLARERGLGFLCEEGDAPALAAAERTSLEAAARRLRYRVLRQWARDLELDGIALGHHRDDQAETVLLRAIRGSGLRGLGGIPLRRPLLDPARPARPAMIIRPLLAWRREEILRFLAERGLAARHDSSNDDRAIARNRVRAEILPALEEIQPGAADSLVRLGALARTARTDLRDLGDRACREACAGAGTGWVSFDADSLASWPVSVLYEVIATAWQRVEVGVAVERETPACDRRRRRAGGGALSRRSFDRLVRELSEWRRGEKRGARVIQLGAGVEAELRYGKIRVRACSESGGSPPPTCALPYPSGPEVTAAARWEEWEFSVRRFDLPRGHAATFPPASERRDSTAPGSDARAWSERFDLDVLRAAGPLLVRSRREGDVFHPLGAPGRKKIKEFFRECEIEPCRRHQVPLLTSGETIQWVVGCRIGHLARCRPETRSVLEIRAVRGMETLGGSE